MKRAILPLLLLALAAPGSTQTPDLKAAVAKCRAVTDSLQRLTCYDQLADSAGGATGTSTAAPPAPQALFAAPAEKAATAQQAVLSRCAATTQKGTQCKRMAKAGAAHCWQHGS